MQRNEGWTAAEIQTLIRHWKNKSAGQIGSLLNRTRNAVCGKAMRLRGQGLMDAEGKAFDVDPWARPAPGPKKRRRRGVRKVLVVTKPPEPSRVEPENFRHVRLVELEHYHCRWPIGGDPVTDPNFMFCGAQAIEGRPYCDEHCRQAYTKERQTT